MAQGFSTTPDEAIRTNAPGFESGATQLQFVVRVPPITFFVEGFLHGSCTLSLMFCLLAFCCPPAGTMTAEAAFWGE